MKNKKVVIFIMSIIMLIVLGTVVYAYLSSWCESSGGIAIIQGIPLVKTEKRDNKNFITVEDGGLDNYVRAKILVPESVIIEKNNTDMWEWKGDYIYYKNTVKVYETIELPNITINGTGAINKNYNVIVVAEATNAFYDVNGNPSPNWDLNINN